MRKDRCTIKTAKVVQNTGQFPKLSRNPRQWTKEDIDKTAKSITEDADFLEDRPVLVIPRGDQYVAFAGNLRLTAAKHVKLTEVPCVVYDPESDEDWDTIKRRAMKDNGSFGAWDFDALANEWDDLPLVEWGVPAWEKADEPEAGPSIEDVKEDDFDEEKDGILVRCKPGDIWELGEHRLMCGDSTDLETVKALMGGALADMAFTSPPYNAGDSEKLSGNTHFDVSKYKNYDDDNADYLELLIKSTKAEIEIAKYAFVNLQMLAGNKIYIVDFLYQLKDFLCDVLIWRKTSTAPAMARRVCNSQFEFVFCFSKENSTRAIGTRDFRGTESNVYDCSPQRKNEFATEHAATFSVEFVGHYIEAFSNKGETILDLFGGTGTTMIAAEQLGRNCYMMELDPHYCDVIIARWEKLTGKEAKRITGD